MKDHISGKTSHVMKFLSFLARHTDAPMSVKDQVWNSALKSAIFYSGETWLTNDLRPAETVYMMTLKRMLGIRVTTCNDIVLAELGRSSAKAALRQHQANFLHKLMSRQGLSDTYLGRVINLAISERSPAGLIMKSLLDHGSNHSHIDADLDRIKQRICTSGSTRRTTYREINPSLTTHAIYSKELSVPEQLRIACSRMRMGSHLLRIETGRWARIPKELRLCPCQEDIQTEEHVLLHCRNTRQLRDNFPLLQKDTISELFQSPNVMDICKLCFDVLNTV